MTLSNSENQHKPHILSLQVRKVDFDLENVPTSNVTNIERIFPYFMQQQQQSNWCWAAVGTSVGIFFQTGNWTQCDTANNGCGRKDCCSTPSNCNIYGYLNTSLEYTKSLSQYLQTSYSVNNVQTQINLGYPVGVRVSWFTLGAHFNVIAGYSYPDNDPDNVTIFIQDPIYGKTQIAFSDFPKNYQSGGTWTHTCTTKPNQ